MSLNNLNNKTSGFMVMKTQTAEKRRHLQENKVKKI